MQAIAHSGGREWLGRGTGAARDSEELSHHRGRWKRPVAERGAGVMTEDCGCGLLSQNHGHQGWEHNDVPKDEKATPGLREQ